ncbi:MAG: response regulator [Pirellulales bacterium]
MTEATTQVLIVEDEAPIRRFLRAALAGEGYRINEAATGEEALRVSVAYPPDVVLLDLGLPDMDGQEVLRRLREWYLGPILVLSARDQEPQKVLALDHGADDYVTKPFGIGELLARMRVALRHSQRGAGESTVVQIADVRVDLGARVVQREGLEIHLTPIEYKLLVTFIKHAGKVLTHRFLLREVWGPGDSQENHYLRVYVAGLRRKLEDDPARPKLILTEQGVGYRLAAEA